MFHFYLSPQAIVKDVEKEDSNYEQGSKTYLEFEEDTHYIRLNLQQDQDLGWTMTHLNFREVYNSYYTYAP